MNIEKHFGKMKRRSFILNKTDFPEWEHSRPIVSVEGLFMNQKHAYLFDCLCDLSVRLTAIQTN